MAGTTNARELADKYKDFAFPCLQVWVKGRQISTDTECVLERAEVLSTLEREPDMAVVVYSVRAGAAHSSIESTLDLGEKVELKAGYGESLLRVFLGYLHEIQVYDCGQGLWEYTLFCLDVKGLMKKNSSYQASGSRKTQQILTDILNTPCYKGFMEKQDIGTLPKFLNQDCVIKGETHYDWLCALADRLGYGFFCDRGELVFKELQKNKADTFRLTREYGLQAVRMVTTLTGQTGSIQINGYNRKDEKIAGSAKWPGAGGPFGRTAERLLKNCAYVFWNLELETREQADHQAKIFMDRTVKNCARLEALHIGIPELRPGVCVSVNEEKASSLSGVLYVDQTTHIWDGGGYRTVVRGARK